MRSFEWCPQEIAEGCAAVVAHSHICITTPAYRLITPRCGRTTLNLVFYDLDPEAIRRTNAYADDPEQGQLVIDGCMQESHAMAIAKFVRDTHADATVIINCEAGISRSPGVVLALRRFYGGDTEEPYKRAHPNMHVTSMLTRVLRSADPE